MPIKCINWYLCTMVNLHFFIDKRVDNCAPKNLWPNLFNASDRPFSTVKKLLHLIQNSWFSSDHASLATRISNLGLTDQGAGDIKRWSFTANRFFSIKLMYSFLIHKGVTCRTTWLIWNSPCLKKIILFNWLIWDNGILTLDNLTTKGCNKLSTATCVMCNTDIETVGSLSHYVDNLWESWHYLFPQPFRDATDLIARSLLWNVWLERNALIFSNIHSVHHYMMLKVI